MHKCYVGQQSYIHQHSTDYREGRSIPGIQDDIFNAFLSKLLGSSDFPREVADELRILWNSNSLASKERILEAIKKGIGSESKNKGD